MKTSTWITIAIVIGIIVISYYALNTNINGNVVEDSFASCIADKAVLYMQTGCFACQEQEKAFGESYKYLNIVNCAEDPSVCAKEGIERTPTWVINGEKYVGYKTLEELSELIGCELNPIKEN